MLLVKRNLDPESGHWFIDRVTDRDSLAASQLSGNSAIAGKSI